MPVNVDSNNTDIMDAAGETTHTIRVLGDTNDRYRQDSNGAMAWGSGSAPVDVVLQRTGTGTLELTLGALAASKGAPVQLTATGALTHTANAGRINSINSAAGITLTLPAATGSGDTYEFYNQTTITSGSTLIQVASASDFIVGNVVAAIAAATNSFDTANTGTSTSESDTITLNGSTKGGIKGDWIRLVDLVANHWQVNGILSASGTPVTPFSAAV